MTRTWVTSVFRNLIDSNVGGPARALIVLREAAKESRLVRRKADSSRVGVLDHRQFLTPLGSSRESIFFILGSGASVESLSNENFTTIAANISVGINTWPLHKFVPSFYAYETVPEIDSDYSQVLRLLTRPDIVSAAPSLLILRPKTELEERQLDQLPPEIRSKTYLYGRISPFTRARKLLGRDISFLDSLASNVLRSLVIDSGASVVRMASLGLLMGFKHLVFVGVDLNNTEYFWERNPSYITANGLNSFVNRQSNVQHETLSRTNRPFPVDEMLQALTVHAKKRYGATLYATSHGSVLADFLPIFEWPSHLD